MHLFLQAFLPLLDFDLCLSSRSLDEQIVHQVTNGRLIPWDNEHDKMQTVVGTTIGALSPISSTFSFFNKIGGTLITEHGIIPVVVSTFVVRVEPFYILTSFRDHTDLKRSRDRVVLQVTIVPVSKRHGIVETRPWRETGCIMVMKSVNCIIINTCIKGMCRVVFKANEELLTVGDTEALHFYRAPIAYTSRVLHKWEIIFIPWEQLPQSILIVFRWFLICAVCWCTVSFQFGSRNRAICEIGELYHYWFIN